MIAIDRLNELTRRGVRPAPGVEGKPRWKAPKGAMTADDLAWLKEHKGELLQFLTRPLCGVCGEDANGLTDGHAHCDLHAPTNPTVRALWEAVAVYEAAGKRWEAEQAERGHAGEGAKANYFDAGAQVHDLAQRVRGGE